MLLLKHNNDVARDSALFSPNNLNIIVFLQQKVVSLESVHTEVCGSQETRTLFIEKLVSIKGALQLKFHSLQMTR